MGSEMIGHSCKSPAGARWEVLRHPTMYPRRVGEEHTLLGFIKDCVLKKPRQNHLGWHMVHMFLVCPEEDQNVAELARGLEDSWVNGEANSIIIIVLWGTERQMSQMWTR